MNVCSFLAHLTKFYNLMIIREGLQETMAYFIPRKFPGRNVHIYEKYLSEKTVSMSGIELEVSRK